MKNFTFSSSLVCFLITSSFVILYLTTGVSQSIKPQKIGWIQGIVKEKLYETPLSHVRIEVKRRIVDINTDGSLNMRPYSELEDLGILKETNEFGEFKIKVPLKGNDWFLITYNKSGFEDMIGLAVPPDALKNSPNEYVIYLFKSNYSDLEQEKLYEKNLQLKESEKMEYFNESIDSSLNELNETDNRAINCTYSSIPTSVNVKNLIEGYNSYTCNNSNGYTGSKVFTEFIAGVVQKEYYNFFGSASKTEGLKAQAVAARTFSLSRIAAGYWANCGLAWTGTVNSSCLSASQNTSQNVLLYNGTIKVTNFFSKCNGDVTQKSDEGKWTNCSNCAVCGDVQLWQRSKACSGHGQPNVCESFIPSANTYRKIYGPGVGLCQTGTQDFATAGFNFASILSEFYTGMCIANYNYQPPSNDNACNPIILNVGSSCTKKLAHNFGATTTSGSGIPNPTCGFSTSTSKDVWFRFEVPSSGQYRIETYKGNITDGVMATYQGSCTSMTQIACIDNVGTNLMPTIVGPNYTTPGWWIYVRFWGKSGAIGTFSICVRNSQNAANQDEIPLEQIPGNNEITIFPNPIEAGQVLYISGLTEDSNISLFDPLQTRRIIKSSLGEDPLTVDISNLNSGLYFIEVRKKGVPTIYKEILIQ